MDIKRGLIHIEKIGYLALWKFKFGVSKTKIFQ